MAINGSDLIVFLDDEPVAHGTSYTIDKQMSTRQTSNKDTGIFDTEDVGRIKITASCDSLMVYDNYAAVNSAFLTRGVVHLAFGERTGATLTNGEYVGGTLDETKFYEEADFIITSFNTNAGDNANATYSISFAMTNSNYFSSEDTVLRVRTVHTDLSANAAGDGFVAALPAGGTAPYTFSWDTTPATTTQSMTDLDAGTYTVTVTDDVAATAVATVVVTEPAV